MRTLMMLILVGAGCSKDPPRAPVVEDVEGTSVELDRSDPRERKVRARLAVGDAKVALQEGKLDEAARLLENARGYDDGYADVHRFLSALHLRRGERDKACAAIERYADLEALSGDRRDRIVRPTCQSAR